MANETPRKPAQELAIQADPQVAAGVYSNLMMISHRRGEFVLDFLFVQPNRGQQTATTASLRSRVVTTPEHLKRIMRALEENIRRYEGTYGPIQEATDLPRIVH
jgi:hypothetical protein